jgi:hypothetical protein
MPGFLDNLVEGIDKVTGAVGDIATSTGGAIKAVSGEVSDVEKVLSGSASGPIDEPLPAVSGDFSGRTLEDAKRLALEGVTEPLDASPSIISGVDNQTLVIGALGVVVLIGFVILVARR